MYKNRGSKQIWLFRLVQILLFYDRVTTFDLLEWGIKIRKCLFVYFHRVLHTHRNIENLNPSTTDNIDKRRSKIWINHGGNVNRRFHCFNHLVHKYSCLKVETSISNQINFYVYYIIFIYLKLNKSIRVLVSSVSDILRTRFLKIYPWSKG